MKTVTKGSGITAYEVQQTETVDELKAALREMAKLESADGFEFIFGGEYEGAEAWARRTVDGARREALEVEQSPEWYAARVLRMLKFVRAEIGRGDAAQAAARALHLGDLLAEMRLKFQWEKPALTGQKFISGRKPGTGGPIRKAIARLLKKNPTATNAELWAEIAAKSPGWEARENRLGKYLDGPKGVTMKYPRFCTVASQERKNLNAP